MKKFLPIFILIFGFSVFGQKVQPKPIPQPKVQPTPSVSTSEQAKISDKVEIEDKLILSQLQTAKDNLFFCYDNMFKSQEPNKAQTAIECREKATEELAGIYSRLSKRPNAIKLLMSEEFSNYSKDSAIRIAGSRISESEINTKSQTELQRIIVIQNQRIIELLEKLVDKNK